MNALVLSGLWNFVIDRKGQILNLILEHVELTVFAVIISIIIGVPLGILITRVKKLSTPVIGFANIVQAIPSLAILGFLIPVIGIGSKPAIVMVILYSLLPIVKNSYTGLVNINRDMLEAAEGMGMTQSQILRKVQLPLAMPVIMAGIRISAVTAVGLMTIAAFVGAGGLGYMVFTGVQTVNNEMILSGAIPACILALLMDLIIGKIELAVVPAGIRITSSNNNASKARKNNSNKLVKLIAGLLCIILVVVFAVNSVGKKDKIVVGSKNFNEQLILGNMMAILIEENTDIEVEKKLNLGGTQVAFNALKSGELDLYADYTGTGYVSIMKKEAISDPDKVYNRVKDYYHENFGIKWLKPLGFNNTYALAVRKDTADKYGLNTVSDLAKISKNLILGCSMEFSDRPDGYPGMKNYYNMDFKAVNAIDGGLRYTSIDSKKTDVLDAFSTDGLLVAFNLKVLEDDKKFFPPYYAAPIVREDTLQKYPEIEEVINKLAGKIDDDTMRNLNYKVDKEGEAPEAVAREFLKEQGLIK